MGQQQLLLLVLGIVIVGIAVVAGIQAFSEGKTKAEQDAAVSDAMRIISDTQAWKLKPTAFGGGASAAEDDFTGVGLKALGYPVDAAGNVYVTTNGCYDLTGNQPATLDIYKAAAADSSATTDCSGDQIAQVTISGTGTDEGSLSWDYSSGSTP